LSIPVLCQLRLKTKLPNVDSSVIFPGLKEVYTHNSCVYVGMTGLDPDVRFDKHQAGIQSNRYAQLFGLHLLPDLYEADNPMSYDAARDMEVELGILLREAGFGVWQA
jgi:hypothetical protein